MLPCVYCHLDVALCLLSPICCPLSTVTYMLPCVYCHLYVALCLLSPRCCPVSTVTYMLPCVYCHLDVALCLLSPICCPLFTVTYMLPSVYCHLYVALCLRQLTNTLASARFPAAPLLIVVPHEPRRTWPMVVHPPVAARDIHVTSVT